MKITEAFKIEVGLAKFLRGFRRPRGDPDFISDIAEVKKLFTAAMPVEGNLLHRILLARQLPRVAIDSQCVDLILSASTQGPILYASAHVGQLEYNIFSYILRGAGLPLAQFNSALRSLRWLPLRDWIRTFKMRFRWIKERGRLPEDLNLWQKFFEADLASLISLTQTDPEYLNREMRGLLETILAAAKRLSRPVFAVPIQVIWDKRPKPLKPSLWEALFGETENPGRLRKIILFLRHYKRRAVVKFGLPISLQEFYTQENSDPAATLYQKILSSLTLERRSLTGPPLKPRSDFIDEVLESKALGETIYSLAKNRGEKVDHLKILALRYAKEIAANIHYSFVDFAHALIGWFFRSFYEGIEWDEKGLRRLKEAATSGALVLVPNHRSHVDYLLTSYLCYHNHVAVPHVAAGRNMAFWPMGRIFRMGGAFFLRRQFQGNPLYKQVFESYLKVLLKEGYLQEFFIEGGRSRTGKLRPPMYGMLSMYSQAMIDEVVPDIKFLSITITYEKVIEQKSLRQELEGKAKGREKFRHLLGLAKYLKGRWGRIYVEIGEPISWKETALTVAPREQWKERKREIVETLVNQIVYEINRRAVVTPQGLAACAILLNPKIGQRMGELYASFQKLLDYLVWKEAPLSRFLKENPGQGWKRGCFSFQSSRWAKEMLGLEEPILVIPAEHRLDLDYYKNTALHYFVSIALVERLSRNELLRKDLRQLTTQFRHWKKLFLYEFRFSTKGNLEEHLQDLVFYLDGKGKSETFFGPLIDNFVESYWVALRACMKKKPNKLARKGLLSLIHQYGQHLLWLGEIHYPEALSESNIENAIHAFVNLGIMRNHEKDLGYEGREIFTLEENHELQKEWEVRMRGLLPQP